MTDSVWNAEEWSKDMIRLLEIERREEVDRSREEAEAAMEAARTKSLGEEVIAGRFLAHARIIGTYVGMYGRSMLEIAVGSGEVHKLTPGDIVEAFARGKRGSIGKGVVQKASEERIVLAMDGEEEEIEVEEGMGVRVICLSNDATHVRLVEAMRGFGVGRVLFGERVRQVAYEKTKEPQFAPPEEFGEIAWHNLRLNDSQKRAVECGLRSQDVFLIHGPPGTGKTTTVVELIRQCVDRGERVMASAASNIAVDNLVMLLAAAGVNVVRVGHPARMHPDVLAHSLDALVASERDGGGSGEGGKGKRKKKSGKSELAVLREELERARKHAKRAQKGYGGAGSEERREAWSEFKLLRKKLREEEAAIVKQILREAQVVLCTLTGAASNSFKRAFLPSSTSSSSSKTSKEEEGGGGGGGGGGCGGERGTEESWFDVVVIDEAGQATEAACWIALPWAPRAILAGDPMQLPPTVLSQEAERGGLGRTLAERVLRELPSSSTVLLDTQYRMHESISSWASRAMYDGRLHTAESVAARSLHTLRLPPSPPPPSPSSSSPLSPFHTSLFSHPMLVIDTAGCGLKEEVDDATGSRSNLGEAKLVRFMVQTLLSRGLESNEVAVITPYNAQVGAIRTLLRNDGEDGEGKGGEKVEKDEAGVGQVEVRSVDGFQGREMEAIVLSFVRSNEDREVGFLSDKRRINVAVTRARRFVCIVADSSTVGRDPFIQTLLRHAEANGQVRSAEEFRDLASLNLDTTTPSSTSLADEREKESEDRVEDKATALELRPRNRTERTLLSLIRQFGTIYKHVEEGKLGTSLDTPLGGDRIMRVLNATLDPSPYAAISLVPSPLPGAALLPELRFSPTFSARQRFLVHAAAEASNLYHETLALDAGRTVRVLLSTPPVSTTTPISPLPSPSTHTPLRIRSVPKGESLFLLQALEAEKEPVKLEEGEKEEAGGEEVVEKEEEEVKELEKVFEEVTAVEEDVEGEMEEEEGGGEEGEGSGVGLEELVSAASGRGFGDIVLDDVDMDVLGAAAHEKRIPTRLRVQVMKVLNRKRKAKTASMTTEEKKKALKKEHQKQKRARQAVRAAERARVEEKTAEARKKKGFGEAVRAKPKLSSSSVQWPTSAPPSSTKPHTSSTSATVMMTPPPTIEEVEAMLKESGDGGEIDEDTLLEAMAEATEKWKREEARGARVLMGKASPRPTQSASEARRKAYLQQKLRDKIEEKEAERAPKAKDDKKRKKKGKKRR